MKKVIVFALAAILAVGSMMAVFAADFTPSVQGKPAPEIETVLTENGEETLAIIRDAQGNEVAALTADDLIITPVSKVDEAIEEISSRLGKAYYQIKQATSLEKIVPEITDLIEEIPEVSKVEDLVVRDLFDVYISDKYKEILAVAGNSMAITFKLGIAKNDTVVCLHNVGGENWKVIDMDNVINNGDGTVTVILNGDGPIAFAVKSANAAPEVTTTNKNGLIKLG